MAEYDYSPEAFASAGAASARIAEVDSKAFTAWHEVMRRTQAHTMRDRDALRAAADEAEKARRAVYARELGWPEWSAEMALAHIERAVHDGSNLETAVREALRKTKATR